MKTIILIFVLATSVLFAPQIMAQQPVVIFETGNYIMVASTDIATFAQEVAGILDWTGTTPNVDRFYPLSRMIISSEPILTEQSGHDVPVYVQVFTLFRDQACSQ